MDIYSYTSIEELDDFQLKRLNLSIQYDDDCSDVIEEIKRRAKTIPREELEEVYVEWFYK